MRRANKDRNKDSTSQCPASHMAILSSTSTAPAQPVVHASWPCSPHPRAQPTSQDARCGGGGGCAWLGGAEDVMTRFANRRRGQSGVRRAVSEVSGADAA